MSLSASLEAHHVKRKSNTDVHESVAQ